MTVKRYWRMVCDRCGTVHPHTFEDDPVSVAMTDRLEPEGWSRKRMARGEVRDLCPDCAAAMAEEMR